MKKRKKKSDAPRGAKSRTPASVAPPAAAGTARPQAAGSTLATVTVELPEPTVIRGVPLPVTLIVLLSVLLYGGMLYLANTAGQFDARVYDPYRSVKQLSDLQPKSAADELFGQGRRVYAYICVQCHQDNGKGNPALFIPPLAGSDWVLEPEPGRIIRIVSKGLNGPIKVSGMDYGGGTMFAAGDQLPGDEEQKARQIAAVLTYVRRSWGNEAPPVSVEQVKTVRAKIEGRTEPWTAAELLQVAPGE